MFGKGGVSVGMVGIEGEVMEEGVRSGKRWRREFVLCLLEILSVGGVEVNI